MLRLYIPAAVVAALIVVFTFFVWKNQDVFTASSITAAQFGERFKDVPKSVGKWVGTDNPVTKETLEQAGAVSHVSRIYVNSETNKAVDMWLIVGHARDVCRHTPDICNPTHGVAQQGTTIKQSIDPPGDQRATFNTARFHEESFGEPWVRYFWAWNGNRMDKEQDKWEAPDNQKQYFGNNTALYKLYFSTSMSDKDEDLDKSVAIEFAEEMLPEINRALFPERYGLTPGAGAGDASAAADADAAAASDEPAEEPAEEPAAEPAAAH